MDHGSLWSFVRRHGWLLHSRPGNLSQKEALRIATNVAEGMRRLHYEMKPKLVHRDLTPHNVLYDSSGQVKICDLGIAIEQDVGGRNILSPIGHPEFKPPEITNGHPYTKKCDIHLFGSLLFFLYTGLRPLQIEGLAGAQVALALATGQIPQVPETTPTLITRLIQACWKFEPKQRPNFKKIVHKLSHMLKRKERRGDSESSDGTATTDQRGSSEILFRSRSTEYNPEHLLGAEAKFFKQFGRNRSETLLDDAVSHQAALDQFRSNTRADITRSVGHIEFRSIATDLTSTLPDTVFFDVNLDELMKQESNESLKQSEKTVPESPSIPGEQAMLKKTFVTEADFGGIEDERQDLGPTGQAVGLFFSADPEIDAKMKNGRLVLENRLCQVCQAANDHSAFCRFCGTRRRDILREQLANRSNSPRRTARRPSRGGPLIIRSPSDNNLSASRSASFYEGTDEPSKEREQSSSGRVTPFQVRNASTSSYASAPIQRSLSRMKTSVSTEDFSLSGDDFPVLATSASQHTLTTVCQGCGSANCYGRFCGDCGIPHKRWDPLVA